MTLAPACEHLGRRDACPNFLNHAFTLVELLTVIGIVAILVGLLLPALGRAKREAQAIQRMSNARQFAFAWIMYAHENGDYLPPNEGGAIGAPPSNSWVKGILNPAFDDWPDNTNNLYLAQSHLAPYLGTSLGVWRCPSDKSKALEGGILYPRTRSYSMNIWINNHDIYSPTNRPAERLGALTQPAARFVFVDEREDSIQDCTFVVVFGGGPASLGAIPGSYHNGAANLSFADGHAERHRWLDPRTNPPLRPHEYVCIIWMPWPPNPDTAWLRDHTVPPE